MIYDHRFSFLDQTILPSCAEYIEYLPPITFAASL